jgi:hypothetical protein
MSEDRYMSLLGSGGVRVFQLEEESGIGRWRGEV